MKNSRIKSINLIIVTLVLISLLSGCQLAQTNYSLEKNSSKLCGVLVTIGLEKMKYYQDAMNQVEFEVNGKGEIELKNDIDNLTLEGTVSDDGNISFDQVKGYYLGKEGKEGQYYYSAAPGFTDFKCFTNATDNKDENSYEATISIGSSFQGTIDIHPVYQRENGSIYAVLDRNVGYMNSGNSTGAIYSQTLSNEITTTKEGIKKTIKDNFKVNVAIVDEAKKLIIKEMSSNDKLITATEYIQGQNVPQKYTVNNDTDYIIVEEVMTDPNKGEYTKLSIYNMEASWQAEQILVHTCSFPQQDGVIGSTNIEFVANDKMK